MTGAIITAVGAFLTAVATILVGWFVKRTDNVAKLRRSNLEDQQYTMTLVGVIRDDYWTLSDAWYLMRSIAADYRSQLMVHLGQTLPELPGFPQPRHRDIEARHAKGEEIETD